MTLVFLLILPLVVVIVVVYDVLLPFLLPSYQIVSNTQFSSPMLFSRGYSHTIYQQKIQQKHFVFLSLLHSLSF